MRAAVLEAPGRLVLAEVPTPKPADDEVVIRVAAAGVCGTDRHIFHGDYPVRCPLVLGHEYAGEVVAVGDGVSTPSVGDRIAVDPNIVDEDCHFCRSGHDHLCSGLSALGVERPGGFAEYSALPARYAYRVPAGLSWRQAAQVEPLACCVHGIDQARVRAGDVVAISGAGPIGCLLIQLLRMQGASSIVAIEPAPARRDHALAAGADLACVPRDAAGTLRLVRGVGPDVFIEASGSPSAAEMGVDLVRRGGTVLLFAVYATGARISISPFRINEDELTLVGTLNNPATHQRAIDLLASGRIDINPVVTHELPLEQIVSAMDMANYPNAGKILIRPGD